MNLLIAMVILLNLFNFNFDLIEDTILPEMECCFIEDFGVTELCSFTVSYLGLCEEIVSEISNDLSKSIEFQSNWLEDDLS